MSTMQAEIYDAFIEAGVSETKARAAATVATIPTNYPKPEELVTKADLRAEIAALEGKMDSKIAELKVHLMQQNRESTRLILTGMVVATSVIVAAIAVLAFVS